MSIQLPDNAKITYLAAYFADSTLFGAGRVRVRQARARATAPIILNLTSPNSPMVKEIRRLTPYLVNNRVGGLFVEIIGPSGINDFMFVTYVTIGYTIS